MRGLERWRGWRALVTGASAGIGAELARVLAQAGVHLVLTARRAERLEALAAELRALGVEVAVVPADLADPGGPEAVLGFLKARGLTVDLLVNNAGLGVGGAFFRTEAAREAAMLQVNVAAAQVLAHGLLPGMVARGRGQVVFVGSIAAYTPVPHLAAYAAGKAYLRSLAASLDWELRGTGVRVAAIHPGGTSSEFMGAAGMQIGGLERTLMSSADVAGIGLARVARGRQTVITGWTNWLAVGLMRLLPTGLVMGVTGRLYRRIMGGR